MRKLKFERELEKLVESHQSVLKNVATSPNKTNLKNLEKSQQKNLEKKKSKKKKAKSAAKSPTKPETYSLKFEKLVKISRK